MGAAELALDLAYALDPVGWAVSVGVTPDTWQATVLRSTSNRILLCCCRQAGKSTTVALRAAHRAIYRPKSVVLCVSPSLRQSGLLFDKIASFVRAAKPRPSRTEDNKLSMQLANGSKVVSLPGNADTIRGYSPSMVLVDEAAFVPDDVYAAVRPMLIVSGGDLMLFSTPHGQLGEFFELWEQGGEEWERIRVPANLCPRIRADDLERERREMPSWMYAQEYETQFTATIDAVFTREQIDSAMVQGDELELE